MSNLRLFNDPFFTDLMDFMYETPKVIGKSIKRTNIVENEDEYRIELAIPGLTKEDVEVKVKDSILIISHKKENTDEKTFYFTDSFVKEYTLPDDVNDKGIKVSVENGILVSTIPKDKKKQKEFVIEIE